MDQMKAARKNWVGQFKVRLLFATTSADFGPTWQA